MFVHSVYFSLKEDLTPAQVEEFQQALAALSTVPTVRQGYIGTPASTNRPVIDRTYSYGLILAFDDKAGHDSYQEHEIHLAFVKQCSSYWTQVRIFDCE